MWALIAPYGLFVRGTMIFTGRFFWGRHIDKHPIPMYARMLFYIFWGVQALVYIYAPRVEYLLIGSILSGFAMGGANINTTLLTAYFGKKPSDVANYVVISGLVYMIIGVAGPWVPNILMSEEIGLSMRQVVMIASGMMFLSSFLFGVYYLVEKTLHPDVTGDGI